MPARFKFPFCDVFCPYKVSFDIHLNVIQRISVMEFTPHPIGSGQVLHRFVRDIRSEIFFEAPLRSTRSLFCQPLIHAQAEAMGVTVNRGQIHLIPIKV